VKIAVIGGGISGIAAASELQSLGHEITVYEANDYLGGHVKTIHVPMEDDDPIPIELGVFMHDPLYIHPMMSKRIKELGIKTHEIPLTFSFVNQKNKLSWSTESRFSGRLRDASIFLKVLLQSLVNGGTAQKISFFLELKRFLELMPEIREQDKWKNVSLKEFIQLEKCSDDLLENWLLPQLMCWWGITKGYALETSIQVIVQSMYLVSIAPQYVFEEGWDQFTSKLCEPLNGGVRTNARVDRVIRNNNRVEVSSNGKTDIYDQVVFAVTPNIVSKLLQNKSSDEETILQTFQTITTRVYLHQDSNWLPRKQKWSTVNLIQDERGSFCTLYFGGLDERKPMILVTWGDDLQQLPDPAELMKTVDWPRTLPTVDYTKASHQIQTIQGEGGVWHCGAHVNALDAGEPPSLWHENAYRSGLRVAEQINLEGLKNDERSRLSCTR